MNTKWLPIVIALVVAIFAGFVALKLVGNRQTPPPAPVQPVVSQQQPATQEVETDRVYVARKPIAVGTVIDSSMIDTQPWPRHLLLDQFVVGVAEGNKLKGMIARSAFQPREPFISSKLANPNDPSLISAALSEGMRLVTISVDAVSGLAGFIYPGDRVDILLTREVEKEGKVDEVEQRRGQNKEMVTQTLATNIKVLAVDQRADSATQGQMTIPSTVSLEVVPEAAHRIALGEETGRLLLLLRGFDDDMESDTALVAREAGLLAASPSSSGKRKRQNPDVMVIRGVVASE